MSYSQLTSVAEKNNIPLIATFELTYKCNLKCSFCYVEDRGLCSNQSSTGHFVQINGKLVFEKEKSEMNLREYKLLLNQLAEAGTLKLVLTGGETMVKKEWLDIAKYARKKGFDLVLFSNGTLINEKIADEIEKLNPSQVEMSLHGANAKTNDLIMGYPGCFDKIINSAKLLRKRNITVILKSTITKKNYLQTSAMKKLCQTLGVEFRASPWISPRSDFGKSPIMERLNEKQLEVFFDQLLENESLKDLGLVNQKISKPKKNISCPVGGLVVTINPFAEVISCVQFREKLGDLRKQSFKEIWQNSPSVLKLRKLKEKNWFEDPNSSKLLLDCPRCPGISLMETGSYSKQPEFNYLLAKAVKTVFQKKEKRKKVKEKA